MSLWLQQQRHASPEQAVQLAQQDVQLHAMASRAGVAKRCALCLYRLQVLTRHQH